MSNKVSFPRIQAEVINEVLGPTPVVIGDCELLLKEQPTFVSMLTYVIHDDHIMNSVLSCLFLFVRCLQKQMERDNGPSTD